MIHSLLSCCFTALAAWSLWDTWFGGNRVHSMGYDWFIAGSVFLAYLYLSLFPEWFKGLTGKISVKRIGCFLLIFMVLAGGWVYFTFNEWVALILLTNGMAVMAYPVSDFTFPLKNNGLRKQVFAKPLLIVFCWIQCLFLLPYTLELITADQLRVLPAAAAFLGALAIWNDVKDISSDRVNGIRTIAVQYGMNVSLRLTILLLIIAFLLTFGLSPWIPVVPFRITLHLAIVLMLFPNQWPKSPLRFGYWVDGIILLPWLLGKWIA